MISLKKVNCDTCNLVKYGVRSIDAIRDWGYCWCWNDTFNLGYVLVNPDWSNRRILKTLRDFGFLSDYSKGRVRIETFNSESDCFEIQLKGTYEPILALIPCNEGY